MALPTLAATYRKLTPAFYKTLRPAQEGDYRTLVTEPCVVRQGDHVLVVYLHLGALGYGLGPLVQALQGVDFSTADRTSGMLSTSRVFGWEPRKTLRKDFCGPTALATEDPHAHKELVAAAAVCEELYRLTNPTLHARHRAQLQRLKFPYTLAESCFTSGIVNRNNLLPYHFDRGNIRSVWSAMLVFRGGVEGGYLAVPELDLGFALPDHSLFMFDGQGLLHGVTPFQDGPGCGKCGACLRNFQFAGDPLVPVQRCERVYRFSVVYYSLTGMWSCLSPVAELQRFRQERVRREERRRGAAPVPEDL